MGKEQANCFACVENRRPEYVPSPRGTMRRGREHLDFYDSPAGEEVKSLVIRDRFSPAAHE